MYLIDRLLRLFVENVKYIRTWDIVKWINDRPLVTVRVTGSFELNRYALDLQQFISNGKY